MAFIAQVASLLFFIAWVVGVVLIDQKRLRQRAAEGDMHARTDVSGLLWVGLLLCGYVVLPLYFYTTRKTGRAALLGVGLTLLGMLGMVIISAVGQVLAAVVG